MHTALCTFEDRDSAERARDCLLQAGFARDDVHLQQRQPKVNVTEDPNAWGVEHEVAVGPRVLASFGAFFGHLLGEQHPHADAYARHVEGGRTVLVVDTKDEAEVQRAHELLNGLQAGELQTVHRPAQRPLREIVGMRGGEAPVTAAERSAPGRGEPQRERAMAAGMPGEQRSLDLREPEQDRSSRDGLGRTRRDD